MLGYLVISMIAYGGAAYAMAMLKSNVSVIVPYTFNTVALLVGEYVYAPSAFFLNMEPGFSMEQLYFHCYI